MPCRPSMPAGLRSFFSIIAIFSAFPGFVLGTDEFPASLRSIHVDGVQLSLPEPSVPDGLDAKEELAALKQAAGKYPLTRFTRESIVSPFNLSRESIKNSSGDRVGHRIDLWFVAYGSLDAIRDQDLFATMLKTEEKDSGSGTALTEAELTARGLKLRGPFEEQVYYRFSAPVLDQVLVQGVVQGFSRSTEVSHFAAVSLAEAFENDPDYPNQWLRLGDDAGSPAIYSGFAGYAKATRLQTIENAVLIECHVVLHEPVDWFKSPNLLSSKLPLVTQDTVRSFRRTLAKQSR